MTDAAAFLFRVLATGAVLLAPLAAGCGGRHAAAPTAGREADRLPDVRTAPGRPPVVLVVREGDPAASLAIAATNAGAPLGQGSGSSEPEAAVALAGVIEARLRAKKLVPVVTPSWDGLRLHLLATSEDEATRAAEALRDALGSPITEADVAPARRKLVALGQRPLRDAALARWARCVGQPYAPVERAGKDPADVDVARLERWRTATIGTERVAFAVAGSSAIADSFADAILGGPAWKTGAPFPPRDETSALSVDVFESGAELAPSLGLHMTLDVGTSSAAVTAAEALGDPRGPLAARLSELDLPFRLREVTGAAHARGGCVGVVLEAAPMSSAASLASTGAPDLAARVADAIALVRLEAAVFLAEAGASRDGRVLSRRSGDSREAAERAAWWALGDRRPGGSGGGSSVVLAVPSRRGPKESPLVPSRESLSSAITRAATAWEKPVVDSRIRVEAGQGEAWVLVGSPCGIDGETDGDSGLTALFVAAAAENARPSSDVRIEPWVATDGAGLLAHGPALPGESPAAHARRIADAAARSFAAEPITKAALGRARADLLRRDGRNDGSVLSVLASALAPSRPSAIIPWGVSEPLARTADGAVLLRAQALRAGPIRVAVLASVDSSQGEAAVRAADRWIARRASETRTCRAEGSARPARPGTYAAPLQAGSIPVAYLAYPLPAADESARASASLIAAALAGGEDDLLERALEPVTPLAHEASAKVLGWPKAPALVVRIVAPEASLDAAVMQARALLDRLQKGGLEAPAFERAVTTEARSSLALDPRARAIAAWRGERIGRSEPSAAKKPEGGSPVPAPTAESLRAFARRYLAEDSMIVVAARPPRPAALP